MYKPIVFVSSTIYDFKDLRSALKYWLTEKGYEVRMSERNDFVKDSSKNSYLACLDSIKECDYYILLIGARAGGLFSTDPKITITQREYEYANELAEQGKIKKLLIFVRQSIWDIREDRRALQRYIENELIKDEGLISKAEEIKLITNRSSSIIKDTDLIFNFLKEVGKIDDLKKAIKTGTEYPKRNWINQFNNFEDIIDVLKIELNANRDIDIKRWNEILKQEISENLARLSTMVDKKIVPFFLFASMARKKLPEKFGEQYTLNYKEIISFREFAVAGILQGTLLSTEMIISAINSGVYLKYDSAKGVYTTSNVQRALVDMLNCIKRIKRQKESFGTNEIVNIVNKFNQIPAGAGLTLHSDDTLLFMVYAAHDYQYNIYHLSKYLLGIFEGIIADDKYPVLYKEGVFKSLTGQDEEIVISPQAAYETYIREIREENK